MKTGIFFQFIVFAVLISLWILVLVNYNNPVTYYQNNPSKFKETCMVSVKF